MDDDQQQQQMQQQQAALLLQVRIEEDEQQHQQQQRNTPSTTAASDAAADAAAVEGGTVSTEDEQDQQQTTTTTAANILEDQIQHELSSLTDIERKQVDLDLCGINPAGAATLHRATGPSSNGVGSNSFIDSTTEALLLKIETESLGRELFRILQDPIEQQQNPIYSKLLFILKQDTADCNFYTNSIDFRIKLLRAEHYDVKKAAKRTVKYMCLLYESFGDDSILKRKISLKDLTPLERSLQRKGYQQLFRFRDQSSTSTTNINTNTNAPQIRQLQHQSNNPQYQAGGGRRIAGSFDLCRCSSTCEPAIDNEKSKVSLLMNTLRCVALLCICQIST